MRARRDGREHGVAVNPGYVTQYLQSLRAQSLHVVEVEVVQLGPSVNRRTRNETWLESTQRVQTAATGTPASSTRSNLHCHGFCCLQRLRPRRPPPAHDGWRNGRNPPLTPRSPSNSCFMTSHLDSTRCTQSNAALSHHGLAVRRGNTSGQPCCRGCCGCTRLRPFRRMMIHARARDNEEDDAVLGSLMAASVSTSESESHAAIFFNHNLTPAASQ
jgi:hypothetical protein